MLDGSVVSCRFHTHRVFNTLGLALATAGVVIAWTQFDGLEDDDKHRRIGMAVMILGWAQPLNALIRPHAPDLSKGEERTWTRFGWQVFHRGIGYITLGLAIYEVFLGLDRALLFNVVSSDRWENAYIGVLIFMGILAVLLYAVNFWNSKRKDSAASAKHGKGAVSDSVSDLSLDDGTGDDRV